VTCGNLEPIARGHTDYPADDLAKFSCTNMWVQAWQVLSGLLASSVGCAHCL